METYDISKIPFSSCGSFLKVSPLPIGRLGAAEAGTKRLVLGTVRGMPMSQGTADLYDIALLRDGTEVDYEWSAAPDRLTLKAGEGRAVFAFMDMETLRFEGRGVDVRFVPRHCTSWQAHPTPHQCIVSDYPARCFHHFRAEEGTTLEVSQASDADVGEAAGTDMARAVLFSGDGVASGALRICRQEELWEAPLSDLNEAAADQAESWQEWLDRMPDVPTRYRDTAELAWLVEWLNTVPFEEPLPRRAILMSKNWMTNVWSWDNCFNALAVAHADPELAWDQLKLMFDRQAPTGVLPDGANDEHTQFGFVKPPIYGWTVLKLSRLLGPERSREHLDELFEPMRRLTEWWYTHRDYDSDGMCQYHHGNDSGWDNATVFDQGYPTEGADLAAHLVLQTEALGFVASLLGRTTEAERWEAASDRQLRDLLEKQLKGDRFFSPLDGHSEAPQTHCLLNYVPMVLGHRLAEGVLRALAQDLSPGGPFLTEHGLATESPDSPQYEPDGYWRGPIWAPSTYLIFDGLRDAGETAVAQAVAERFCDMCAGQGGMYENYDALTGEGLRDPGYSWTASVFVLLAHWLHEQETGEG